MGRCPFLSFHLPLPGPAERVGMRIPRQAGNVIGLSHPVLRRLALDGDGTSRMFQVNGDDRKGHSGEEQEARLTAACAKGSSGAYFP